MINVLNLANVEMSDIDYKIIEFSDGEKSLEILSELDHKADCVRVVTRISSMDDLYLLLQADDILTRHGIVYDIYVSYFMSMRMDRVMDWNRPFSLSVAAKMVNLCRKRNIYVFEPHSHKTLDLLGAQEWKTNFTYKRMSCYDIKTNDMLVFPDAGAESRYGTPNIETVQFYKKRDLSTGQIIGLDIANKDGIDTISRAKVVTVIDDLCDAGGTFIGVAKRLKEINPNIKLRIMIAHAVNRRGIDNMAQWYDEVVISNSYKDWDNLPENVKMVDVVS